MIHHQILTGVRRLLSALRQNLRFILIYRPPGSVKILTTNHHRLDLNHFDLNLVGHLFLRSRTISAPLVGLTAH